MLRGMHYMCWFKEDWNYHPSMMSKRLQQVQDIVDVKGNMLLWSCLGSGAIGVPYLYKEAFEKIQPRFKFYGYLNDSEFCRECEKRGIDAYAVLWKAQLWEFPAELNEQEDELLSLNKLIGEGKKDYIGMSELSTDRYPKLFDSIDRFFPDGLKNSRGEVVKDYLEELSARTLNGNKILSSWLMVPGHDHKCYTPCGNNPAYMTYMQKLLQIMIDAGAGGILIDEFDVQLHALNNGGCFCPNCMERFREYLIKNPSDETGGLNLDNFDYSEYLLSKGYCDDDLKASQLAARFDIPLIKEFIKFNVYRLEDDFKQIVEYVKKYSRSARGRELPVTANLFNCLPHGEGLRKYCDVICGEKSGIKLRQDAFYKFGYSFMDKKEGSFIEDPNDYILQILEDINHDGNDSYILFMLEPLAHGFNVAISYGGWLANNIKDSFYPNMDIERSMGKWLVDHDCLFAMDPVADVAVIYDHRSALAVEMLSGNYPDQDREGGFRNFFDITQQLCNRNILYNVIYVSEDQKLTSARLKGYKKLVLPDAYSLSVNEKKAVEKFAQKYEVIALGRTDKDFFKYRFSYAKFDELASRLTTDIIKTDKNRNIGIALHKSESGYNLHLVNYNLNSVTRCIEKVNKYHVELNAEIKEAAVHSYPSGNVSVSFKGRTLDLENLDIYTIVELKLY